MIIVLCFCKEEECAKDRECYSNNKACGDAEVAPHLNLVFNGEYVHKNQQSPDKKEHKVSLRREDLDARLVTDAENAQNEKQQVK